MFRHLLMALVLAALFLPAVALATEIGNITQVDSGDNAFILTEGCYTSGQYTCETLNATVEVYFTFNTGAPPNHLGTNLPHGQIEALLTLNAITYTPVSGTTESGFSGSFSIIADVGGANLLSGTFGPNAYISGNLEAYQMTFSDSSPPLSTEVVFTSYYLDFTDSTTNQSISLSATNLENAYEIDTNPKGFLTDNSGVGSGNFSAVPAPVIAPEPTTLLLSGGELLGMGFLLRKRKSRRVL